MAEGDTVQSEIPVSTGSVGAPGADDMLAQLAGDEIDRLLAEADADGSAAAGTAPSDFAAPLDVPAENAAVSMPPVEQTTGEMPTGSQDLDTAITAESAARLAERVQPPDTPARIVPDPQPPTPVLESPVEHAPVTPALASNSDDDGSLPLYIHFLEFLNSPLDSFPDSVREIVGKLGLATMMNAIGMLVYLRFFRHK